jgi:hypothetical protein
MARLTLTPVAMPAKWITLQPTANSLDVAFTAAGADFADGAGFTLTGKEIVIVQNANVGAQTVTVTSVADPVTKRVGDITAYSIGIGEFAVLPQFSLAGWQQADGKLYLAASAADVKFLVLRLAD